MSKFQLNILISYAYLGSVGLDNLLELQKKHGKDLNIMMDSGAYTAFTVGKQIDIHKYIQFLTKTKLKINHYATLDVIRNVEATEKNYSIMRDKGLEPMPVFTTTAKESDLEKYYRYSDYIMIWGILSGQVNNSINRVARLMKIVNGRKVHLLGFTRMQYVAKFKPYSIDSSSWNTAIRYGGLDILTKNPLKIERLGRKDFVTKPSKRIEKALHKVGISVASLRTKDAWSSLGVVGYTNPPMLASSRARVYQAYLVEKHFSTRTYFAIASKLNLAAIERAYEYVSKNMI